MPPGRSRPPDGRRGRAITVSMLVTAVLCAVAGCADDQPFVPPPVPAADQVYVSVGDSYAAGDQPAKGGQLTATRNGFAYQLTDRLTATGRPLRLLNFGCTGYTSTDVLTTRGCTDDGEGIGGPPYADRTHADAVVSALRAYPDRVRLVTVSLGGNDLNGCAPPAGPPGGLVDEPDCLDKALATLHGNLDTLLTRIRGEVGPGVAVVGLTYPDIFLGAWVGGDAAGRQRARASVALFRDRLNPMLAATYAAHGATFVDITALSGAYGPWDQIVGTPDWGPLPAPVARVCALTNYCRQRDLHPTTAGYALIAEAVQRSLQPG